MEDEKKEKGGTKEEWLHMIRIGTTVFVTFVLCILFIPSVYAESSDNLVNIYLFNI